MSRPLLYLASPYSLYAAGQEAAYLEACIAAADLIRSGYRVYSPIAASHPIATHGGLDNMDAALWLDQCEPFMEAAAGIVVLMLEGWQESHGVTTEMEYFANALKPIVLMVPGEVPDLSGVFA